MKNKFWQINLIAFLVGALLILFIPMWPIKLWNVGFTEQTYYWVSGLRVLKIGGFFEFIITEVIGGLFGIILSLPFNMKN